MPTRESTWLRKPKAEAEADQLMGYLLTTYGVTELIGPAHALLLYKAGKSHPHYIAYGDRDIRREDSDWPGDDEIACTCARLYYKYCHPSALGSARYKKGVRLIGEWLQEAKDRKRIIKRRLPQ